MKKNFLLKLFCALLLATTLGAAAQEQKATWAGDVTVAPTAGRYYKNARVSVAYDGSIYVGRLYSTVSAAGPYRNWEVLKSTDTGHTFTVALSNSVGSTAQYRGFDMITAGADAANFKIFVARSARDTDATFSGINYTYVMAYSAAGVELQTLVDEQDTFNDANYRGRESISMSSDWKEPNTISAPYELDIVMQKSSSNDSVIIYCSKDAGVTVSRRGIYGSPEYIRTVSGSIGSTVNATSQYGRFGIVWDQFTSNTAAWGKIYGQFVYADDGTDPGLNVGLQAWAPVDNFRNPVIILSQQTGTVVGPGANDIRTMLLTENNLAAAGFSSVASNVSDSLVTGTATFNVAADVKLGSAAGGALDPHGVYDPAANNFLITYYDSAIQALVYDVKPLSATIAAVPTVVKANYRDAATDLGIHSYPRTDINIMNDKAVFVWNDNSATMFDAEYAMPTSVQSLPVNVSDVQVFPNPANDVVNIAFVAAQPDEVTAVVYDMAGRVVLSTHASVSTGANKIPVNISTLPAGNYTMETRGTKLNVNVRFTRQ